MADFLEVVESIKVQEASVQKIFGSEGKSARTGKNSAEYMRRLAETAQFVSDIYTGRRPAYQLKEALGTSDFPYLFGDVIDRQVLQNYNETPQVWPLYARRATVSDFRLVRRFAINGSEAVLGEVPQQTEYPESKISDAKYEYAVKKYGRRIPFAWEAMVNDDLDALKDIPARFGKAARRSEEKFAVQLHVLSTGPDTTFYSAGNKNIVNTTNSGTGPGFAVNPQLSIVALQQAMVVLANQVDSEGEPIYIEAVTLEVPPSLEITARNILNADQIWIQQNISPAAAPGAAMQQLIANNWMKGRVTLAVNPYLPIVNTTNGNSAWYLHANPGVGRPAMEMGFLRGYETPQIFIKMPNSQMVGGGVNPMNGDFDTDSIEYKVRHVFGGVQMDPKMSVASTGANA